MLNAVVIFLMVSGFMLFFATTIGLLRFPDFYTRVHAAGKGDTLSTALLLAGLIIYYLQDFSGEALVTAVKLSLIVFFVFLASPTATHAIIDAGYEARVPYWTKRKPAADSESYPGPERRREDRQI